MATSTNVNGKRPLAEDANKGLTKRLKSSYQGVITVVVGDQQTPFTVQQDMICDRSPFFKAACSKRWVEHGIRTVHLPGQLSKIFQAYLEWAYSQTKDITNLLVTDVPGPNSLQSLFQASDLCLDLCRLWILAEYLGDTACMNVVIANLFSIRSQRTWSFDCYGGMTGELVHDARGSNSKLRKWLVDSISFDIRPSTLRTSLGSFPSDLVLEIFEAYANKKGATTLTYNRMAMKIEDYHE